MKRFTLFTFLFSISVILSGQTRNISIDEAKVIADRNAEILWGKVAPAIPIVYYSADDNIVAYRFNYVLNEDSFDQDAALQYCREGIQNGCREAQWGNGKYGNIMVSARTDMPVILEYGNGISAEFAYNDYLQKQAESQLGSNCTLDRIYYINTVSVWYHYSNGTQDVYIQPFSPAQLGDYNVFMNTISDMGFLCQTGDYNDEWDQYQYGGKGKSKTTSYIPYYDEMPFYDWSYGCSPTAAAMLVAYWDVVSMHNSTNYSKFVDYHFERTDPLNGGGCSIDSHVPNVQEELATAMNTNLSTGGTDRADIAPGYSTVATNNGYSFSCSYHHDQTTTWYFNEVMDEIDADRPLHISISGHSITGVGYNDVDQDVATHYTHQSYIVWVDKSQLQATYPIIPGGAFGLGIEIIKPDGDQTYCGTGSGENLYAGDVYEITWNYDSYSGSYVNLFYSTNHGVSWSTIASNTPNDGVYDWVIPSGINSTSCRIATEVHSSGGTLWGCDGSYGDFQIYSGGSLPILSSDVKVNTTTDPDYYQFNNSYATWCAVGVRCNTAGENWSMRMYSDNTFTTELISSSYTTPVDFIVMDRHHMTSLYRGIKAYRFSGSNTASVEFEGDQETFTVGTNPAYSWTAGDVVEMFDVYLTPGIYNFNLDITSGTADLDFALFGSTDAVYYKNRNSYFALSNSGAGGVDESFTIGVTTADYYGLCIWANDANTASYVVSIEVGTDEIWEGTVSTDWNNSANWSAGYIPDETIDVTIPSGCPNYPVLSGNLGINTASYTYDCKSLTVN
ncbi:MAG: C39 family peptidase, partial [Bacteroidales bacterium]|nr:C39 family peptidase [Bacteroidales bacterium]